MHTHTVCTHTCAHGKLLIIKGRESSHLYVLFLEFVLLVHVHCTCPFFLFQLHNLCLNNIDSFLGILFCLLTGVQESLQLWCMAELEDGPWPCQWKVKFGKSLYIIVIKNFSYVTDLPPLFLRSWMCILFPSSHPPYGSGLTWLNPPDDQEGMQGVLPV